MITSEYTEILKFIRQDNARNYFIRLGLESSKSPYEKIIGELDKNNNLKALLFMRKSGNLQFYAKGDFDLDGFANHIAKMNFKSLISPASYCDLFLKKNIFASHEDGAIIGKLDALNSSIVFKTCAEIESLKIEDLDEVVKLYEKVFNSFSSKSVMERKINSSRGRGVCIWYNKKIISVAQSEFEEKNSALIVGVATDPEFQGRGLASKCLTALCNQLLYEDKDLYLQYDNLDAGRIYEKIGFIPIDRVRHYNN